MPFRRKHRNPLFGSSRSGDKENVNTESMQVPLLSQPTGLFRCHSDNNQRFCCDINPNTMGTHQHQHHRNGVLSTKEKMSNLLQLNTTLVKEVSSLRASQLSLTINMEDLTQQLQAKSSTVDELEKEKNGLENKISHLGKAQLAAKQSLEAEKKNVEDRLECVSLIVDNLQTMNGVLAKEAARLREDADRYVTEKHTLLADLDTILGEKSILETLVDSLRASEKAIHAEREQAVQQAALEKEELRRENQFLLSEKNHTLAEKNELRKEVATLETENSTLVSQAKVLLTEKDKLEGELRVMVSKKSEVVAQLNVEKQALTNARTKYDAEKRKLLSNKTELENSLADLRKEHLHAIKQSEEDRQVLKQEVEQLSSHNAQISEENKELQQCLESSKKTVESMQLREASQLEELSRLQGVVENSQLRIQGLLAQEKVQQDELCKLQRELLLTNSAAKESQIQTEVAMSSAVKQRDDAILTLQSRVDGADDRVHALEREKEAWKIKESELQSNILALECKLFSASQSLDEAIAQATMKADQVTTVKEKLEKASQAITSLEGMFAEGKEKQKCLETHIQTMKGDLLVADDVAIQAINKAKAAEKEAVIAIERKARDASQKIGALESKLAAMAERQTDLENHIRFKENAYRAAVKAESAAKARLNGLLENLQERGEAVEGYFEMLREAMAEMQNSAVKANQGITSLQSEFGVLMDVKVIEVSGNGTRAKKRRGKSKVKAWQADQNSSVQIAGAMN
ncbi:hypothetical protein L7F22_003494 [Adiantum nelumboides]|nr:hypothetical protein [Adiantum nelumboides]